VPFPANPGFVVGNSMPIPDSKKVLVGIHIPKSDYRPHIPTQRHVVAIVDIALRIGVLC
jgi:hypothetical protein